MGLPGTSPGSAPSSPSPRTGRARRGPSGPGESPSGSAASPGDQGHDSGHNTAAPQGEHADRPPSHSGTGSMSIMWRMKAICRVMCHWFWTENRTASAAAVWIVLKWLSIISVPHCPFSIVWLTLEKYCRKILIAIQPTTYCRKIHKNHKSFSTVCFRLHSVIKAKASFTLKA